jgi:hypothetical protein
VDALLRSAEALATACHLGAESDRGDELIMAGELRGPARLGIPDANLAVTAGGSDAFAVG